MKKLISAALLLLLLFLLLNGVKPRQTADFNIITAGDIHYIAPQLHDNGEYFTRLVDTADGKLTMYSEEITDAFLAEAAAAKPEALILTGDLSFNGALESHEALARKLAAVEAQGITVLVLPGNHDVYNSNAARFSENSFERVQSADSEAFRSIYAAFGYDEALSEDADSMSYIYRLNDKTLVLMLDFNTEKNPRGISEATLSWVERELKAAKSAGDYVIAAGHQNIYRHSMFDLGYVINNADALSALLSKYKVELFLSGHMHIQHILTENSLTEISTEALSVYPCMYGVLETKNGGITYHTERCDVSAWAKSMGSSDERLLDFDSFAADYFTLHHSSSSGVDRDMLEYYNALNAMYFRGELDNAAALDPDGSLTAKWLQADVMTGSYISSIRREFGKNYNFFTLR